MKDCGRYCKCVDCPLLKKVFFNWTIKDQLYIESLILKSGASYSEFMKWFVSVVERVKNE